MRLVSQRHRPGVGLEGGQDLVRQGRRQVQRHDGLGVFSGAAGGPVGQGEQLRKPEGEVDDGAVLQRVRRVVVEVAQVGDVELELARHLLLCVS